MLEKYVALYAAHLIKTNAPLTALELFTEYGTPPNPQVELSLHTHNNNNNSNNNNDIHTHTHTHTPEFQHLQAAVSGSVIW